MKRKTGLLLSLILGASLLLAGCGSTQNLEPLENEINLADLAQGGTAAVSFTAEDIHTDGEETTIDLTVYNYELFDAVEVSKLAKGDTITADGNKIKVETVEENDGVFTINGGTENGGLYLRGGEGGTYYEVGLYNEKFFHDRGVLYHYLYGWLEWPLALRFLYAHKGTLCTEVSLQQARQWMRDGIREAGGR